MKLQDYEDAAAGTAMKGPGGAPFYGDGLAYLGLGLAGESGEAVDCIKKSLRPGRVLDKEKFLLELGDALWYLTMLARTAGSSLEGVAIMNLDKLQRRQAGEGWK